ncbi:MAG TPA: hypothetical protein VKA70_10685 [Blastocatellia bacterium]|nr:hypothetical protein [Blastocatellia bacterium]
MELPGSEFYLWFMCGALALGLIALSYRTYKKRAKAKAGKTTLSLTSVEVVKQAGTAWVLEEIDRFRNGGELSESFIRRLSQEERAFIEVALIDALTKWPREDQHRLRSMLIKHGYDEMCARRLMKDAISERVRASTLLTLLRPQSVVSDTGDLVKDTNSMSARAARGGAGEGEALTRNE